MAAIDEIRVEVKRGVKTAAVPAIAVMAELYGNALPEQARAFEAILRDLQEYTRELFRQKDPELKAPTGSAFNNCNGKWSEYILQYLLGMLWWRETRRMATIITYM